MSMIEFTGKERDAETGLDYFEKRYFSSAADVRNALGNAISDEQKRRTKEQKKHCQSGQSGCSGN